MDVLSGLLSQTQPKQQSAHDTITRLCDRLAHSTLIEDRRAAVLGLKAFSRDYRETVAADGVRGLILTLHGDKEDDETCRAVLETLRILISTDDEDNMTLRSRLVGATGPTKYSSPLMKGPAEGTLDYISLWLTDEFTQKDTNMTLLFEFFSSHDFYIKLYALQLVSAIISNRPARAQECIFGLPLGISVLTRLLDETREVLRNEALLVLYRVTNEHMDIQKIVAFEGAFDKLFAIIEDEGGILGSLIVRDCLLLLSNLLRYNVSNQRHFRETGAIRFVAAIINKSNDDLSSIEWTDQNRNNFTLLLEICRLLVPHSNDATPVNQKALHESGVLMATMRLTFGPIVPLAVRAAGLLALADTIRGNQDLQEIFINIEVPYISLILTSIVAKNLRTVPVLQALLNWTLTSSSVHHFDLRVAAQSCLSAALYANEDAKLGFVNYQLTYLMSVRPDVILAQDIRKRTEEGSVSPTQSSQNVDDTAEDVDSKVDEPIHRLYTPVPDLQVHSEDANIFTAITDVNTDSSLDPYTTWFACVLLLHTFEDSRLIRDLLRSIQFGNEENGEEIVTIIPAIAGRLTLTLKSSDPRVSMGLIMLLSYWLFDDTNAVNEFLGESSTIQSLISLSANTKSDILEPVLAALLGIIYLFSSKASPIPRLELHQLLIGTLTRDQYTLHIQKIQDKHRFRDLREQNLYTAEKDSTGLPQVFFDHTYVDLINDNYSGIRRALDRDPLIEPSSRISHELYENLKVQCTELESQVAREQGEKAMAVQELVTTKEELEVCQEKLKQATSQIEASTAKLKLIEESHDALEKSQLQLKKLYDSDHKALGDASKYADQQRNRVRELETKIETLTKSKEKSDAGINKMGRELITLTRNMDEKEKEVKSLQKKLSDNLKLQTRFSEQLEVAKKDLAESQTKVTRMSSELEAHESTAKVAEEKLATALNLSRSFQDKLAAERGMLEESREELRNAKIQLQESHSKCESLNEQLESIQRAREETVTELEKQSQDYKNSWQTSNAALEKAKEDSIEKAKEFQARIDELEQRIEELRITQAQACGSSEESKDIDVINLENTVESHKKPSGEPLDEVSSHARDSQEFEIITNDSSPSEPTDKSAGAAVSLAGSEYNSPKFDETEHGVTKELEMLRSENRKLSSLLKEAVIHNQDSVSFTGHDGTEGSQIRAERDNEQEKSTSVPGADDQISKAEYDDLVLVLMDMEEKKNQYKERLKQLDETVSDDESASNAND